MSSMQAGIVEFYLHDVKIFKEIQWKVLKLKTRGSRDDYLEAMIGSTQKQDFIKVVREIVESFNKLNGTFNLKEFGFEAMYACYKDVNISQNIYMKAVVEVWDKFEGTLGLLGAVCINKIQKEGVNVEKLLNTHNTYLKLEAQSLGIARKLDISPVNKVLESHRELNGNLKEVQDKGDFLRKEGNSVTDSTPEISQEDAVRDGECYTLVKDVIEEEGKEEWMVEGNFEIVEKPSELDSIVENVMTSQREEKVSKLPPTVGDLKNNKLLGFEDLEYSITLERTELTEEESISLYVKCMNKLVQALKEGPLVFESALYYRVTDCIIKINELITSPTGKVLYKAFTKKESYYIRNVRNNLCHFSYTDASCLVDIYMVIGILVKVSMELKSSVQKEV